MNFKEDDIKGNPIYKEEFIRYRAKLDEDDRRAEIERKKKQKELRKMIIIYSILSFILYLMLYFMVVKPIYKVFLKK
ncbi:hypothetical protein [Sporanaerobacter acetigenes]|uniref:hypothetical protein n=1 Tax=Sporanaerobacter acetigenes TaxID=165813 RepID=UPI0033339A2A